MPSIANMKLLSAICVGALSSGNWLFGEASGRRFGKLLLPARDRGNYDSLLRQRLYLNASNIKKDLMNPLRERL